MTLEVLGSPAPKGSAQAFFNKHTGRAHVVTGGAKSTRERMKSWDGAVREAALDQLGRDRKRPLFMEIAMQVSITFRLVRPANHYGKGKNAGRLAASAPAFPWKKPDIDKLARATLDSLTDIVYDDDSRIAKLELEKEYAAPGHEGATIIVRAMA